MRTLSRHSFLSRLRLRSPLALVGATASLAGTVLGAQPARAAMCGLLDDGAVHLPGNYKNGESFTSDLPALGATVNDDAFGCPITRLSNGPAERGTAEYHDYAPINAVNADDTKVLLESGDGWWIVKNMTGQVVAQASLATSAIPATNSNPGSPRWSSDPNTFYTAVGNALYSVNVSTGSFVYTLLATFADYTSIEFPPHSDIGADGDHVGIQGTKTDGSTKAFAFQVSTLTRYPEVAISLSDHGDEIEITPNDQVLISRASTDVEVYQMSTMTLLRTLPALGGWHHGIGRGVDGADVFVLPASPDTSSSCSSNGIETISVDTAVKTCVFPFNWWSDASHVSVTNNGWIVWSNTDFPIAGRPQSTAQIQLPDNWQSLWLPSLNEVVMMKTDGSQAHRMVHHRSRPIGTGTNDLNGIASYWDEPRATVSRDGAVLLFDSNWGVPDASTVPATSAYADVYMVPTGLAGGGGGAQPVTWTNLTGASASGDTITKTSTACDGCDDSGGSSTQQIASGTGSLQFDASSGTTTFRMVGLSRPGTTVHYPTLDFAILLAGNGKAQVWEDGNVQATVNSYAATDTFKIVVSGASVTYYQNSTVIYTNGSPTLVYPLAAYASLWSLSSAINDVVLTTP